jgi:hypothetical protein
MKAIVLFPLILFSLASCKKEKKTVPVLAPAVSSSVKTDTIPDKAVFKLKLAKDSTNTDETMFVFSHRYRLGSFNGEDAVYFAGNGQVSLASVSKDGEDLSINGLPYTPCMSIGLDIHAKTSGSYLLKISYEKEIPADIEIWIKDTYLRDSVNARTGNYSFNIDKADTNSFGGKRFRLILKNADQQAAIGH